MGTSQDFSQNNEFRIKKIISNRRYNDDKMEYFCLLKSKEGVHYTKWLKEDHIMLMGCQEMIEEYHNQQTVQQSSEGSGFEEGNVPDRIIGATIDDATNETLFLMKWKNKESADLVRARYANLLCPQVVIEFYETHLVWHKSGKKK